MPCLDLYTASGITAANAADYTAPDRHHPNAAGYAKVAPLQVDFLRRNLKGLSDTETATADTAITPSTKENK